MKTGKSSGWYSPSVANFPYSHSDRRWRTVFSSSHDYSGNPSAVDGNSSENLACQKVNEGYTGSNNGTRQLEGSASFIFLTPKKAYHSGLISLLLRYFAMG
jgi:hypothetical protein